MSGNLAVSKINGVDISVSPVATESKVIGVNQTWQDVTGSRALGTTYTNSTGKPIMIVVYGIAITSYNTNAVINGVTIQYNTPYNISSWSVNLIVPNEASFSVSATGTGSVTKWSELR